MRGCCGCEKFSLINSSLLLQMLKFDTYSLLGWSDGGITAIVMAAKYPHRIRKCIALGASTYVTKEEVSAFRLQT